MIEHEHDISELIRSACQLQSLTALSWKVATLSFEVSIHESQGKSLSLLHDGYTQLMTLAIKALPERGHQKHLKKYGMP